MSRKKLTKEETFPGLSGRLRNLRADKSQEEFGRAVGISKAMVSKYESGAAIPSAYTLKKIADFGGVTVEWLLRGEIAAPEPAIREHAPVSYTILDTDLDEDALAHVILLLRDWLRRKRDKISAPSEAKLLAKMYRHWLTDKEFPDDWVIEKLARGDS